MEDIPIKKKNQKTLAPAKILKNRDFHSSSSSRSKSSEKIKRKAKPIKKKSSSSSSPSPSNSRSSSDSRPETRSKDKKNKKSNFDKGPVQNKIKISAEPVIKQENPVQSGIKVGDIVRSRYPGQDDIFTTVVTKIKPENQGNYKHARKLYIGNIPLKFDELDFVKFLNHCFSLGEAKLESGNPVISANVDSDKSYAFAEFRSIEETTACLALDGIIYQGKSLKIKRPKQYDILMKVEGTRPVPNFKMTKLGVYFVSPKVEDSPTKLFVGGLPHDMDESEIIELLMKVGRLKSFYLVKDKNNISKGFAFCEYFSEQDSQKCVDQLNSKTIAHNRILQVKKAFNLNGTDAFGTSNNPAENLAKKFLEHFDNSENINAANQNAINNFKMPMGLPFLQPFGMHSNLLHQQSNFPFRFGDSNQNINQSMNHVGQFPFNPLMNNMMGMQQTPIIKPTNVICLEGLLNPFELDHDSTYEEIYEDLKSELIKLGPIRSMLIPRQKDGNPISCLGKVYIEFEYINSAILASSLLREHKYDGTPIKPIFYDPVKYMEKILI